MSGMFRRAEKFDRDLSSWDVLSVKYCSDFSWNANNWSEAKPNFTNCNPGYN